MPSNSAPPHSPLAAALGPLADANCIVLCLDHRGRITFLNRFGLRFFGYRQSDIIGSAAIGTLFSENAHGGSKPLNRIDAPFFHPPPDTHQIWAGHRQNGDPLWLACSFQPLPKPEEKATAYLCIAHDVTDHMSEIANLREAKTQLGETLRRYRSQLQVTTKGLEQANPVQEKTKPDQTVKHDYYRLFSAVTTEGILFHDDGIAIEVNEAFAEMVECPRDQIIGTDILQRFIPPEQTHLVKQKMAAKEEHHYEVIACSATGRRFPVEILSRPGKLAGRPCRVVCVKDISRRKKTERKIIQAQKMEAIGTLSSGLVHDLNNMLAGIQGNVDVIRRKLPDNSPHRQSLDLISQIVDRGAKLSGQILGYARGGQSELTEIDLNRLVEDTLAMFGSANRQVNIQTRLSADTPGIKGDRTQIEQVLLNLMINAVQAMPTGGRLTIETKPTTLTSDFQRPYEIIPGDYAMLVVHDTGHGMDPKTQKLIFEPFFTTKDRGQGTGLGLASTYGIIKSHKGYIDVSSEPGVGSRFSVILPATVNQQQPTQANTTMDNGTQTILMVDDEKDFLLLGHQMLNLLGYQPITAENCHDALNQFNQSSAKIDLVILDMIMPDGDVDKTIQQLRQLNPEVRILLSSGHSQNGETGRRLMQHCDGFIQKPFRLASLSEKIKQLIGTGENEDQ